MVACEGVCTALSQNAAASGGIGIVNNFDSEYVQYTKSVKEKSTNQGQEEAKNGEQGTQGKQVIKHHILSDKHHTEYTPKFKKITDKYNFKLSNNKDNISYMTEHKGRYPTAYHNWCLKNLEDIHKEIKVVKSSLTQQQQNDMFLRLFKERIAKEAPERLIRYTHEAKVAEKAAEVAKEVTRMVGG